MADDRFRWARPPRRPPRPIAPGAFYEASIAQISQLRAVLEILGEKLAAHGVPVEPLPPEPARPSNDRFGWKQGRARVEIYPAPAVMEERIRARLAQVRERLALLDRHGITLGDTELDAVNSVLPPSEARD